ncbi:MAG: MFS transporter [Alphaproteobacteria bacterium]|nr:MFS transporter [Alphaproteobacteria bacterium]MBU6472531.1 MFS transporter [Alphaproteobacteria bacterium]MDE2011455.1 MFS transporter [Alphaproteobacteria bacterium]MDE2071846.1 MFS transporter [Alphaproteobacteria bacterium]MDE2350481.1 MFS transporter [Alphaproteobacteria bacterium]
MDRQEFRAATSLAAVFSVRMLGLFMIYPVFVAYARHLSGATPYKIGLALGIYGLSQGLLQIPFGLLSDKISRKAIIYLGLLLFAAGSAIAAISTSIDGVIVGRVLQGAGAVGSVVLALVADLTTEENRTKAMALVGITIGGSFMVALVAGPVVAGFIDVSGIFWLMVALAFVGIAITRFVVPHPPKLRIHRDAETVPGMLGRVLSNGELLRLDLGIFVLHAMLTASFLVIPKVLHLTLGITSHDQWLIYLPVLLVSVIAMVPAIIVAEKYRHMKAVFVGAVALMAASQCILYFGAQGMIAALAALTLFFTGFNILEASLPSLVTKTAPPEAKGTATGIYSSSQFLGIFIGGVGGGWANQAGGTGAVFAMTAALGILWLLTAVTMKNPSYLTTRLVRVGPAGAADPQSLAGRLRQVRGVAEAVVVAEEGLAYLKVDSKLFDAEQAENVAAAA